MTDDDEVPEEVQEYAEENINPPEEGEQPQPINKAQFRAEIRALVDRAIQSGLDSDDVEEVLEDLAGGVPYYYEDAYRYIEE